MDFATLKAYMTSASIKENANTTLDYMQKRLNMTKVDRQTNRGVRLTQFRKIPENMSACNTPQSVRSGPPLDGSKVKPALLNTKLFEERQKLRQQRLREFKEKKEKIKQEEANKKPMFKVTHASLETYDLEKMYILNKGSYRFTAPKNVHALSFLGKTPTKAQESPRKRITRATTRLQNDLTNEVGKIPTKIKIDHEHATSSRSRLGKALPNAVSIENSPQKTKTSIKSRTLRSNHREKQITPLVKKNDVRIVQHKTTCLQSTKSDDTLNYSSLASDLFPTSKSDNKFPSASDIKTLKTKKVLSGSLAPYLPETCESANIDLFEATVNITKAEQKLIDSNFSSNKGIGVLTRARKLEKREQIVSENIKVSKTALQVNNVSEIVRKIEKVSSKTNSNTEKAEVDKILTKTPTKVRNNVLKTSRFLGVPKSREVTSESISNERSRVSSMKISADINPRKLKMNNIPSESNYKSKSEEFLVDVTVPKVLIQGCLNVLSSNPELSSKKPQSTKIITRSNLEGKVAKEKKIAITKAKAEDLLEDMDSNEEDLNKTWTKTNVDISENSLNKCTKEKTPSKIVLKQERLAAEVKQLYKTSVPDVELNQLSKTPPQVKSNNAISSSSKKLKIERTTQNSKAKALHSEQTDMVDSQLQPPKINRRNTRSNSANTPSKTKFELDFGPNIISSSPLDLKIYTHAKSSPNKNLTNVTDDVIMHNKLNFENNINEANIKEQGAFTKILENVVENGNAGENKNSLKTPTDNRETEKCAYISPFVTVSRGKNSARKEYTQRMGSGGTFNSPALQQSTNVKTAAEYFTLLLDRETKKINKNCEYWNTFKNDNILPEEAVDMIDVAIGQGNLLNNKKMQKFRNLIQYSLEEQADMPVRCMDLHGYWDVLNIEIVNVSTRFESLPKMRDNNWQEILPEKPKKVVSKKVVRATTNTKRSNKLRDAIKSARLQAKALITEVESNGTSSVKTPKSETKTTRSATSSAKGTRKRISTLRSRESVLFQTDGSPHIMIKVSQVAKSVDRLGSVAVLSAKSILKKRQDFKAAGRRPKVVLFDVSDDVFADALPIEENNSSEKESPFLRKSTRMQ